MRHSITKLIGNTEKSYYRWKKEKRLVISLLEKYFTKAEIDEFLETEQIARVELNKSVTKDLAYNLYDLYFNKLFAKENPMSSTFCRAYFLSFLEYINNAFNRCNNINDILKHLNKFEDYTTWSTCDNSYTREIKQFGEGRILDDDTVELYCPFDCKNITYKLLINFTPNDVRYLLLNIKNNFKYFYEDLEKIQQEQNMEFDGTEYTLSPWITELENRYNLMDINTQKVGNFDIEIFRAEYKCIKENRDIKSSRDTIDNLIEEFQKMKFSLQNEERLIKKIVKL